MSDYKVFAINPGSTSTKIGLFEGEKCLFSKNVSHDAKELEKYDNLTKQLPYRKGMILDLLKEAGFSLDDVDVFVGRGGGLLAMVPRLWAPSLRTSLPVNTEQKPWSSIRRMWTRCRTLPG